MPVPFTQSRLDSLADDLSDKLDAVALGTGSWDEVCRSLTDAFPASCCLVLSENPVDGIVDGLSAINIEPAMLKAYGDYYAFRNPWSSIWGRLPPSAVAISERDFPVRLIERTEFYNDFVRKIPNLDASTGMQVDCAPDSQMRVLLHYSKERAPDYDAPADYLLRRLMTPLRRSVDTLVDMQSRIDLHGAELALVEREDVIAFVVDIGMRTLHANQPALDALSRGDFLSARPGGRVGFRCEALEEAVSAAVSGLIRGPLGQPARLAWGEGADGWLLTFTRLPRLALNPILEQRRHVLVQCRSLTVAEGSAQLDKTLLAGHYRLTPAEMRLCESLVAGQTLAQASVALGVSIETTRCRVKTIFQKTGTHRQAELILLLKQMR